MNETPRTDYLPKVLKTLESEMGRQPDPLPPTKPEDYAPKRAPYISQAIKVVLHAAPRWHKLSVNEQEALDLIATSISYILTDEKTIVQHWTDIEHQASEAVD